MKLDYDKMCLSKNKYKNKTKAFIQGKIEYKLERAKILYTYLCPYCYNWHLTHNSYYGDVEKYLIKR